MKYTVQDGFPYYIELTENQGFKSLFLSQENMALFASLDEEEASFRYAPGKWSIKQMLGHIIDHERIMTYRALRISRKDPTALAGYDQDVMVDGSRFDELSFEMLLNDFKCVRAATNSFIQTLSDEQLQLKGLAWKYELTVEEVLRATIGHEAHHMLVLKDKYSSVL